MFDLESIKNTLEKGEHLNLPLSKKETRVFVEITKDMLLDDVILIKDHPGRPLLRGIVFIVFASIFYPKFFGLATFLYKSKDDVACEVLKTGDNFTLGILPLKRKAD
jgi:hypothetical protein